MERYFAGKHIEDVVNDYSDILLRLAFSNTKSMVDAEDIVQDVYIKLLDTSTQFVSDDHLKAWLLRVTINKCKDFFRSSWFKRLPLEEALMQIAPEEKEVMEEIFSLKQEDRNIIHLYYYEGYSVKEIAHILNKKENTISSKLGRARKKLKVIIEEGRIV